MTGTFVETSITVNCGEQCLLAAGNTILDVCWHKIWEEISLNQKRWVWSITTAVFTANCDDYTRGKFLFFDSQLEDWQIPFIFTHITHLFRSNSKILFKKTAAMMSRKLFCWVLYAVTAKNKSTSMIDKFGSWWQSYHSNRTMVIKQAYCTSL